MREMVDGGEADAKAAQEGEESFKPTMRNWPTRSRLRSRKHN